MDTKNHQKINPQKNCLKANKNGFWEAIEAPDRDPTLRFLGAQEATYLKIAENLKIAPILTRECRFGNSWGPNLGSKSGPARWAGASVTSIC